jgi:parallel beta-helix repeat protein
VSKRRPRRLQGLALLAALALLALSAPAAASEQTRAATASQSSATVYVVDNTAANCSDTGPGSAVQPFCTIAKGGQVALSGDTVLVRAGAYAGTSVNPANSGVTFSANPGVTIQGGPSAFVISGRSNVVVSGFTISGTSSYGISVSGGSSVTISSNTESYAGTPIANPASGIYLNNVAGGVVSNNVTHDNSAHGIYLNGSTTGVLVKGNTSYHNAYQYVRNANGIDDVAPGNTIIGNLTYDNEDSGINIYPGGNNALVAGNVSYHNGDHGIDDYNVSGGRLTGNTIYYNCTTGINVEGSGGNYLVENNISMNNATGAVINPTPIAINPSTGQPYYTNSCNRRYGNIGIWDSVPATSSADYNLVYQSNGSSPEYVWAGVTYNTAQALYTATGQEAHGIFADPLFANPAAWNFQLTGSSPAIDSADSLASGEQSLDLLGNPRVDDTLVPNTGNPAGSYYDRGAYEYQPPASGLVAASENVTATAGVAAPVTLQGSATSACDLTFSIVSGPAHGSLGPITNNPCVHGTPNTDTASVAYTATIGYQGSDAFTYTVSDGTTTSAPATVSITVSAALPPRAALTVAPTAGAPPLPVIADASSSVVGTNPIASYTFAWGDGSPATGPQTGATASHTYTSAGSYTATVTVTDTTGLASTTSQTVTVTGSASPPTAALTVTPNSGPAPLAVTANASASTAGSNPIASYTFSWGDGSPATGPQTGATASHTYTSAGSYTATVTVTDTTGLASTTSQTVTVTSSGGGGGSNLVGNPGFETGLSGWNTSGSGSGVTLTQVAGGHSGSYAALLTNTSTSKSGCTLNDSPNWVTSTSAGTYTGSLWVKADSAGAKLNLRFREYSGSTLLGTKTTTISLSTGWQQVTVTYTVATAGTSLDFNAYTSSSNSPPGTCFYADDASITYG